jgi:hypothetical protein
MEVSVWCELCGHKETGSNPMDATLMMSEHIDSEHDVVFEDVDELLTHIEDEFEVQR